MRYMRSIPLPWKQEHARKAVRMGVNVIRVITALWLVAHFTLTILYVFPTNPVKVRLKPLLDATIGTYFSQSWRLFAPKPISSDYVLLVRPLSDNEFLLVSTKGLPSDGWYDLSSPLLAKHQSNRFSTYGRFARVALDAMQDYLDDPDDDQLVQPMVELASSFCKDIGQNNANYVALQIDKVLSKPWSERGTSKPRVVERTLVGIYLIDPNVKNAHLYQI